MSILKSLILVLFFLSGNVFAFAQTDFATIEKKLSLLGKQMVEDSIDDSRNKAAMAFNEQFMALLKEKGSFSFRFDSLVNVGKVYAPKNKFRILTWQEKVDYNTFKYHGVLQLENKIIPLEDRSMDIVDSDLNYETTGADNWYGVIYYNIVPFKSKEGEKYLLFGYKRFNYFNTRKVVDVLTLNNKTENISFGAPVFHKSAQAEPLKRLWIEYAADSRARLNFDTQMNMIVMDHLIPSTGMYGQGQTFVTDGSYEAYVLKNNKWNYVDKLATQVMDEPPMLEENKQNKEKGTDLFGRKN